MAPFGLLVTGASFAAFRGLHWGLQLLPTPGSAAQDRWKWRNICVSLVHSLLTGAGALLGLSLYPQMAADPIHGHPPWALVLVAVSVGYFLADGADMLWNQTLGQAWELLCHHFVVRLGGGKTGEEACPALGVPFSHPLSVLWLPRESLTPANPWAELGEGD